MTKNHSESSASAKSQASAFAAPGQTLGFALQYTLLTSMLLRAPERSACSLEVLDDVAVENNDGNLLLLQSKSALTGNPISDRAKPFWKTMHNWLKLIESAEVNPKITTFQIYVSKNVSGSISNRFHNASTLQAALDEIAHARKTLLEVAVKDTEPTHQPCEYIDYFFKADANLAAILVKNFRVSVGSGSPQEDLEALIRTHPISPSKVGGITNYVCGWVKREVDKMLEKSRPAVIARDTFHAAYRAHCVKMDREMILNSSATKPTHEQHLARFPDLFVRQLDLIELTYEQKLEAVSDYLMAAADRTHWSKRGDVDESSFNELDDLLKRQWKNKNGAMQIEHKNKNILDRGKLLYFDCMAIDTTVQAMKPPAHFIPGCLHKLADVKELGWHPNYHELIDHVIAPDEA
jgi:hypothetical protein